MNLFFGKTRLIPCKNYQDLGQKAASHVASVLRHLLQTKEAVRAVFAAGESQSTFLQSLATEPGIAWNRIECINMDDFWDPRMPECFSCGYQTRTQLYDIVRPKEVHLVQFNAPDAEQEVARFDKLLRSRPIDLLCQGIGTSGHLALNEPDDTQFDDPHWMRLVDVCEQSKKQLRADPNFQGLGYIPEKGITMTIPAILSATHLFTIVPLALKKPILNRLATLSHPTESLPASILLQKESTLFVDHDSCPDLWK